MLNFLKNRKTLIALSIFSGAFLLRVALNLIFFFHNGWFSSHLIEIWYYYGVANNTFSLSLLDPTFALLRLTGYLLPSLVLYQAVAFQAALVSALTALLIFYWLDFSFDRRTGFWGGVIFAVLPAPLTLSLVNFSHDIVQVPLLVLFFWAAGALYQRGGGRSARAFGAAALFFLIICGLSVGPLMAAAVLVMIFSLSRRLVFPEPVWRGKASIPAIYLAGLAAVNLLLFFVMKANLLDWAAPLAESFRGIDLASQIKIKVGDLQPLPPDAFWNRYTIFVFFLPWGLWRAFKRRSAFIFSLFFFSLALALVVNRGARILDLAVVVLAAVGIADWNKKARRVTLIWIAVFAAGNLFFRPLAAALRLAVPYGLLPLAEAFNGLIRGGLSGPEEIMGRVFLIFSGFFLLAVLLSLSLSYRKKWARVTALFFVLLLQGGWVLTAARTSSDQVEYEAYRWLDRRARPGEKIFAAWNQGYFIETVTDLEPLTSPSRIDFPLYRIYWRQEAAAVRELAQRGVKYIHVNSRYFGITSVNEELDRFQMRGNTIIGPPPHHIRSFARMRRTLLYRMLYQPGRLKKLTLIYEETGRRVGVRIFELAAGKAEENQRRFNFDGN